MFSNTEWFTQKVSGKVQINSIAIYKELSAEIILKIENNLSVSEILNWIKNTTIESFRSKYVKNPEVGALNNAAGRWNEFIATSFLSEIILDINQQNDSCIAVFSLPNSRVQSEDADEVSSKFINLFNKDGFSTGSELAKIAPFKDMIFLPSPDYIIVDLSKRNISTFVENILKQQAKAPDSLAIYDFLKGKLQVEEVKAAASLKTSNRPDRRYQPLFEAAMIKSMGYILQQDWKYYMVASELSSADMIIFNKAIAPHGIVIEQNIKLVDGTYIYSRKQDLVPLVEAALNQKST